MNTTNLTKLRALYLVVADFPTQGIGSGGDCAADCDTAQDQFAEMWMGDIPARLLEMDLEAGTVRDLTPVALLRLQIAFHKAGNETPLWLTEAMQDFPLTEALAK